MDFCCGHAVSVTLSFKDQHGIEIASHNENCENIMDYLCLLTEGECPVCANN